MRAAAAMSGAVDLSALKQRADAQRTQSTPGADAGTSARPAGSAAAPTIPSSFAVDETTFDANVLSLSEQVLVVVELTASWSEQSAELTPVLEQLAEQANGRWVLAEVDVEANPRIQQAFGVQSVPTVVAIAKGQPVSAFQGPQPADQIAAWVGGILDKLGDALPGVSVGEPVEEPTDPRLVEAEAKLDEGDLEGALAAYEAVVEADPANEEAASAARNVAFLIRAGAHDPAVVTDAAADDVDGQLAAADVLLLDQRPEEAFDRLIALVKNTSGDERTAVRTRLLSLFELFDPAEPFVMTARRKLASALF
ncbi:tetratricopeptide repeat protein [Gordonia jinhuaensis]|uniref:Co-chaperone YbbN n=2 Tax=Gordonia jinhuaensis TaxID=1517702 RepID=A0A916THU1_9ACTN|nr:co-chaperone YbbN [Gordonia jinhuaensis]